MNSNSIKDKLVLPCGVVIKNRIAKAAMTERLADSNNHANEKLDFLYNHWSNNGAGLLISGNIMVDKRYKESAGNIVLEDDSGLDSLKKMTKAGKKNDTQFWSQISHPGRQATIFSTFSPIAPSPIKLKKLMLFAKPSAMTISQIQEVEDRFIKTAELSKKSGFTGVHIHSAHGYLLSQFLAPNTNKRED
jgi:2,4-dienoyl-CoA reductase-like NADH-dependent reductase (Old Yellow Enzyme family)